MQSLINLWLWRYRNVRLSGHKYHLRADADACRTVIAKLAEPQFVKVSFALREVPEAMTRILSVRDPRFIGFERLRIFRSDAQDSKAVFEETSRSIDLHLTDEGIGDFSESLSLMMSGDWDFSACNTWFWGIMSEQEYRSKFA